MKQQHLLLRILLGIASVTHIVMGIVGIIPPIPIAVDMAFYGATKLELSPQFEHILQMYGAYMFAWGIMAAFAAWNPVKNKVIIYGLSILLLVRGLQRLFFFAQANEAFGISAWYYWAQTALFLATAVIVFMLRPKDRELTKA
jgi:hypothetical protein